MIQYLIVLSSIIAQHDQSIPILTNTIFIQIHRYMVALTRVLLGCPHFCALVFGPKSKLRNFCASKVVFFVLKLCARYSLKLAQNSKSFDRVTNTRHLHLPLIMYILI